MTIESRLAEIRARCDAATEGPWREDEHDPSPLGSIISVADNRPWRWVEVARSVDADAEFIAASRTDLPALLAAVEAVMKLHKCLTFPDDGIGELTACGHCDNETWPCPTIRDIAAALEADTTTREEQTND